MLRLERVKTRFKSRDKENLPAEQVFKSIEILKGKPASRLPGMMKALNQLLGVECTHYHLQDQWEKEEPEAKLTSRRMFKMIGNVNRNTFAGENRVTCFTCHRGGPKPPSGGSEIRAALESLPQATRDRVSEVVTRLGSKADLPAEQAFENIQILKGVPAARLPRIMSSFTVVLGVECEHCHVAGDYAKEDKAAKQTARTMWRMVADVNKELFGEESRVACWTCHRGRLSRSRRNGESRPLPVVAAIRVPRRAVLLALIRWIGAAATPSNDPRRNSCWKAPKTDRAA